MGWDGTRISLVISCSLNCLKICSEQDLHTVIIIENLKGIHPFWRVEYPWLHRAFQNIGIIMWGVAQETFILFWSILWVVLCSWVCHASPLDRLPPSLILGDISRSISYFPHHYDQKTWQAETEGRKGLLCLLVWRDTVYSHKEIWWQESKLVVTLLILLGSRNQTGSGNRHPNLKAPKPSPVKYLLQ